MTYATTEQLKQHLGITDTDQDAYLTSLLERVSSFIDTYTGVSFNSDPKSVTDELYERHGRVIWLHNRGITNVSEVKVKSHNTDSYKTLDTNFYQWTSNGRLSLSYPYTFVQVSYEALNEVPRAIEGACIALAADVYQASANASSGGVITQEQIGDVMIRYGESHNSTATTSSDQAGAASPMAVLDMYRVRPL